MIKFICESYFRITLFYLFLETVDFVESFNKMTVLRNYIAYESE